MMIESGLFDNDLPLTFIRGYIRSYSKLLDIPEEEVTIALDLIKPKLDIDEAAPAYSKTDTRTARTPSKPFRPLVIGATPKFKLAKTLSFFFILIALLLFGNRYWNKYHANIPARTIKKASEQVAVTTTAKIRPPEDNLPVFANLESTHLESLAPPSNLNANLMRTFKVYPLYSLLDQLNRYIIHANNTLFAITDPSTDIGKFTYTPKKNTRHRSKHVVRTTNAVPITSNNDPYNDT
jgi:hypothetical protein